MSRITRKNSAAGTTDANATYAPIVPAQLAAGLRWAFCGDSITNGSAASNFVYSYMPESITFAGGMVARPDSFEAGTPGDTSTGLLARMDSVLANGAQGVVVMIGTNDAGSAVPLATYAANIIAIIGKAKAAGCPVVLCTITPRGSSASAAITQALAAYNTWIRMFGPSYGCHIADTYAALVDTVTGYLAAAYDSGDATHPTTIGHTLIAAPVAKAMIRARNLTSPYGLIRTGATTPGPVNLVQDPLVVGGTIRPAGWFEFGTTGTAASYTLVADTTGVLPAGRWAQVDKDAVAGGVTKLSTNALSTAGWVIGDRLLLTAHLQIEDVSGTWQADVAAGTCAVGMSLVNQSGVNVTASDALQRCSGIPRGGGVYDIGPVVWPVTVPAGTTAMNLWFPFTVPTGKHVKLRIGAAGVINLTTLGLDASFNWAPVAVLL